MIIWGVILIIVGALLVVRLAPTDPAVWNQPISATSDKDFRAGAVRVLQGDDDAFARLYDIALSTARTRLVAGSVEEGRATFVTRTFWIGFPDYTTVELENGQIRMLARLRFGRHDWGVNKARLENWLEQLRS